MNETKFTPGPWIVDEKWPNNRYPSHELISGGIGGPHEHRALAQVVVNMDGGKYDQGRANAALIAAAPDLYAALEEEVRTRNEIRKAIDDYHASTISIYELQHRITGILTGSFVGDNADAALAKAMGET